DDDRGDLSIVWRKGRRPELSGGGPGAVRPLRPIADGSSGPKYTHRPAHRLGGGPTAPCGRSVRIGEVGRALAWGCRWGTRRPVCGRRARLLRPGDPAGE